MLDVVRRTLEPEHMQTESVQSDKGIGFAVPSSLTFIDKSTGQHLIAITWCK